MATKTRTSEPRGANQLESVQDAIRQSRPFRSRRQEALIGLLLTAEAARRPMQELLGQYDGLTQQQYNVLRILRGAGPAGLPTLEIAERMIERTPGITRLLDRLETKQLVARERSATDRRQVYCRISTLGKNLLKKLDRPVDKLDERTMRGLDDREVGELIRLLDKLRHHVPGNSSA